jgi:anti-anti-sigma factor
MDSIVNIEISGKLLILKTQGYLNKDLGEEILEVSKTNIGQGVNRVIINLEHSNIVNSIGASILIELIEELQEVDGSLAFCSLTPIVEKTFNIMGLTKYCATYDSQETAVQAMA